MKLNVKIWGAAFAIIALSIFSACNKSSADNAAKTNSSNESATTAANTETTSKPAVRTYPLPPATLDAQMTTMDGKTIKLADLKGKVVIVNQWATWCGPCRMEIPELMRMREELQGQDFEVVGLTIEDDRGNNEPAIREYVKENQIPYPVAIATDDVWMEFASITGRGVIPQSFVLNRNGEVTAAFAGFNPRTTPKNVRKAVDEALKN